jgi:hypothetical protein
MRPVRCRYAASRPVGDMKARSAAKRNPAAMTISRPLVFCAAPRRLPADGSFPQAFRHAQDQHPSARARFYRSGIAAPFIESCGKSIREQRQNVV